VALALAAVESEIVVIHDAARPLTTPALIDEVVAALLGNAGAAGVIAAAPITDTVKRAGEPRPLAGAPAIAATERREYLWAAQTPQAFRVDALRHALGSDTDHLADATDEAMLVEQAGGSVLLHPAPASNLKVTTLDDLRVAELLLAQRRAST
jgi:2-C-methyl-D-erythritol 4-phosphate cytidylyltransferase